jgi:hypothetical protein
MATITPAPTLRWTLRHAGSTIHNSSEMVIFRKEQKFAQGSPRSKVIFSAGAFKNLDFEDLPDHE